jgi:hypothetical protein
MDQVLRHLIHLNRTQAPHLHRSPSSALVTKGAALIPPPANGGTTHATPAAALPTVGAVTAERRQAPGIKVPEPAAHLSETEPPRKRSSVWPFSR